MARMQSLGRCASFLSLLLLLLQQMTSTSAQLLEFCGRSPCKIPLLIKCQELADEYVFQGSCCHLEDVLATGGCLVTVDGDNNCAWFPRCGQCDHERTGCNMEYRSQNDYNNGLCPLPNQFDVLRTAGLDTQAGAQGDGNNPSMAPTCSAEDLAETPPPLGGNVYDENDDANEDNSAVVAARNWMNAILVAVTVAVLHLGM